MRRPNDGRRTRTALLLGLICLATACVRLERLAVPAATLGDPLWAEHDPASTLQVDHSAWDRFLGAYLSTDAAGVNRVAYGQVTLADRAALADYLEYLGAVPVERLARAEQLAFWINLYNARTVALVLAHYPVASVREIRFGPFDVGPWSEPLLEVRGRKLSLNDVEHGILRPIWRDPRLHYVLNCAAVGCPNLGATAYTGDRIEQRLAAAARAYVNDPRGVDLAAGDRLIVSKIYLWFEEDFGGNAAGVLAHLRRFAAPDLTARLAGRDRIDGYDYDWALNDRLSARAAPAPARADGL